MHITQVSAVCAPSGVSGPSGAGGVQPGNKGFSQALETARGVKVAGLQEGPSTLKAEGCVRADGPQRTQLSERVGVAVQSVAEAQARLDAVLRSAQSGRGLSPAALLGLQADVYRSSQLLELAGKVVERGSAGIRQVLTTQL